jgi:hypothetical protein
MRLTDRRPLPSTPATPRISARSNNRYGAVLSSLHGFWTAREAAITSSNAVRRDAYSVVLFNSGASAPVVNDFASTPDQLLGTLLGFNTSGGTNFSLAIQQAQAIMEQSWSTERQVNVVPLFTPFKNKTPIVTDCRSSFSFLMVNVVLATTSCRNCAAQPSDLGKNRHLLTVSRSS